MRTHIYPKHSFFKKYFEKLIHKFLLSDLKAHNVLQKHSKNKHKQFNQIQNTSKSLILAIEFLDFAESCQKWLFSFERKGNWGDLDGEVEIGEDNFFFL